MGLFNNRVERSEIKPGDHIYTYRAVFTYSHHGIFVGGNKVVHFTPDRDLNSSTWISSDSSFYNSTLNLSSSRCSFSECGFKQPNSGVVLSCEDCFLQNGSLYRFEYGVSPSVFLAQVRGGTCSTAKSDPPEAVIHRALYLLQSGFGNYDVFDNNCEDFALYCKTGLRVVDRKKKTDIGKTEGSHRKEVKKPGDGTSGQASAVIGAPLAAILFSPLKWLMPNPVVVATITAGMYCVSRYANDLGVRDDVIKVPVEEYLAVKSTRKVAGDSEDKDLIKF